MHNALMLAVTLPSTGHDPPHKGAICASRQGMEPAIRVSKSRNSLTRCAPRRGSFDSRSLIPV